jgi:hypothetical protein
MPLSIHVASSPLQYAKSLAARACQWSGLLRLSRPDPPTAAWGCRWLRCSRAVWVRHTPNIPSQHSRTIHCMIYTAYGIYHLGHTIIPWLHHTFALARTISKMTQIDSESDSDTVVPCYVPKKQYIPWGYKRSKPPLPWYRASRLRYTMIPWSIQEKPVNTMVYTRD